MSSVGRLLHSVGLVFRETGQALDRLGCRLQGNGAFKEQLNRHRTIMNLFDHVPKVPKDAFVAPNAAVIGDVSIGNKSSIWYNVVLRGDVNSIRIGSNTNIQDGSIVHVAKNSLGGQILPTIVGNNVTVGHNAVLHACTLEDNCFVGMGATIMDGAHVASGSIVGAGSVVLAGTKIPQGQVWLGNPAKFKRDVTDAEKKFIATSAEKYAELAEEHAEETAKSFEEIEADKLERELRALTPEDVPAVEPYTKEVPIAPRRD
eukprot:jgi/Mesvir1/5840/Mv25001-RA.1